MADFWLGCRGGNPQARPPGALPLHLPGALSGPLPGQSLAGHIPMTQMAGPCCQAQVLAPQMQIPYVPQDLQPQHAQQALMQVQRLEHMAQQLQASSLSNLSSFRPEQRPDRPNQRPSLDDALAPVEAAPSQASAATVVDVLTLATVRAYFPTSVAQTLSADAAARAFRRFGEVVGLDMQSCRSKGEVIVTFSEPKAAQRLLMALTPEKVLDFATEFAPPAVERPETRESVLSSTNEQSSTSALSVADVGPTRTSSTAGQNQPGEIPDYATLLAPTPGRLPTPFCADPTKDVQENAHQFIPENIVQGRDLRTSIILGGLPKTCSSERFLHTMKGCQLITKLRFFYLPVEKPRGRAVGYIFMDFQHATDILEFWTRLQELAEGIGGPKALQNLYVSYSRIQGRDQLLEHFGGSDIMFEPDANRRPQFFFPQD